jgi:hypothetical protein
MFAAPAVANGDAGRGTIALSSVVPARGGSVSSRRPAVAARFAGGSVDPNSVQVFLDARDVTNGSVLSPVYVSYAPRSPLSPGRHRVRISGSDDNGNPFSAEWSFRSGASGTTLADVRDVRPANGATVPAAFVVSGRTTPGARVAVLAGATQANAGSSLIGTVIGGTGGGGNSDVYEITAGRDGRFSAHVAISAPAGSSIGIVIGARDPRTGAAATPAQAIVTAQ